jgi:hypothetical protein
MSRSEPDSGAPRSILNVPPLPPGVGRGEGSVAGAGDEALTLALSQGQRGPERDSVDWRGWLALAWIIPLALLYARMILEQRAPGLLGVLKLLGARPRSR